MTADVHTAIIGGGVTGLASAAAIAARGLSVCVIERHVRPGMETSTHNSGVIHAGLYYPAGTLKATLCVEGLRRLYRFCATYTIPCDRCGKLVVGGRGEVAALEALRELGTRNGAEGLEIVDERFIQRKEPRVRGYAALWSPDTGRVEAEALVRTLLGIAQSREAIFLPGTAVSGGARTDGRFELRTGQETIVARTVVNAGGIHADEVSASLGGEVFTIYPCRGEYAELRRAKTAWVNGLVYPLPEPSGHGLGVHLTKTVAGAVLLGPTARYQTDKQDYEGNRLPLHAFLEPTRRLLPGVEFEDLTYGGSGIRPKLHPPEEKFADFLIRPDANHPTLIHAAGIDSPGLTSCLAIGERVAALVEAALM